MSQPKWKLLANLGDKSPVDHGGLFVYIDENRDYPAEMERLEPLFDDDSAGWEVRRVVLEQCTLTNGILSDNKFHPLHPAWFAESLDQVADCCDLADIRALLCSSKPVARAIAYRAIGDYHGWDNLDSYPLTFTSRDEIEARYATELATA